LASKIAHLNYLKAIDKPGMRADTRLISLFASETLTDLHLDHRPVPEEGAQALAKTLPAHDETETLSLTNTGLDDVSTKPLSEVLEKLNIKSLILSKNKLTGKGAEDLAKGLATNASLTELDLEDNLIDDAGVAHLAANLALKPHLTKVNLNGNKISGAGVKSLVEHLGNPDRQLPELHLARNQIGDEGAAAVGQLLKTNHTITSINLSANKIGNKGVEALVASLGSDSPVVSIDLSNNEIGVEGALALHKLIQSHSNIVNVNLSGNKNIVGGESLAPFFKENFAFSSFVLNRV